MPQWSTIRTGRSSSPSLSPPPQWKKVTGSIPGDETKTCSDCLYSFVLKKLQQNACGEVKVKKYKLIVRIGDITGTVGLKLRPSTRHKPNDDVRSN